jgi:hypothetical protein
MELIVNVLFEVVCVLYVRLLKWILNMVCGVVKLIRLDWDREQ